MNTTIIQAIQQKQILELRYHGYSRLVEPHAYGIDKHGKEKLRCYQIAGGSVSNDPVDWKLLNVADAHSVHLTGRQFSSARHDYKRGDKAMQRIYAEL
jgi:hypothetical protein